ncbi:MAG: molybdopterin/thiamine biosynthesis adenylyltransferase [Planctomycetota bacterium]|jgi:molybdopterin/thiamine biosynthesis adenylyltransferase
MALNDKRFDRQVRYHALGEAGQQRLQDSTVLIVGCGALGGVLAQSLVRSGVGQLRLVDRDVVELSNLPRQVLFEDRHANEGTPKADAAAETLARIGGPTRVEAHARHVDAEVLEELAQGVDLILDGTDNLDTRYLINDWCVEHQVPWVYGGVVGAGGLVLPVRPGHGPCLVCVFREPPPPGSLPTCDTAGVLQPAVGAIASLQAGLGLRLLVDPEGLEPALVELDVWGGEVRRIRAGRDEQCPCCGAGERRWLHAERSSQTVSLCGRNTVQVRGRGEPIDMPALAERLAGVGEKLQQVGPLLRFHLDDIRWTVFRDGRALMEGTEDANRARSLYDRYIGS